MAPDMNLDWRKQNIVKKDGNWTVDGIAWNDHPTNTPDHLFIGVTVTMPVNSASPPHRHGGAAVAATVIKGYVLNQTICDQDGTIPEEEAHQTLKIYGPGESWYEPPGCHHVRNENAGDEEAMFVASFVIEEKTIREYGMGRLVVLDVDTSNDV